MIKIFGWLQWKTTLKIHQNTASNTVDLHANNIANKILRKTNSMKEQKMQKYKRLMRVKKILIWEWPEF